MNIKNPVTVEEVKTAIASVRARGEQPTIEKLRQEIGRGSLTSLLRLRKEILEPQAPEPDRDPEAAQAFRQLWETAVEAGRKREADKTAEARAEVEALSREAERLEGECGLLEKQLAETRASLNRALEDAATARQEAKEARAGIAGEQAKATQSEREKADLLRQIVEVERLFGEEKARASKLEGKLEMLETQIVPRTADEMAAKMKRKGIT
jgi:colicin import membrane protein